MKLFLRTVVSVLVVFGVFLLIRHEWLRPHKIMTMNQMFILSDELVKEYKTKAERGDSDAAMKLFEHYEFGHSDPDNAYYYLDLAHRLGNEKADAYLRAQVGKKKE